MTTRGLLDLCGQGKWDAARKLLKNDITAEELSAADPSDGLTPLHHACLEGPMELVRLLLRKGANPSRGDHEGTTALHIAAMLSSYDMIELIFREASAAPDANITV